MEGLREAMGTIFVSGGGIISKSCSFLLMEAGVCQKLLLKNEAGCEEGGSTRTANYEHFISYWFTHSQILKLITASIATVRKEGGLATQAQYDIPQNAKTKKFMNRDSLK